jgi:hypothetical protein
VIVAAVHKTLLALRTLPLCREYVQIDVKGALAPFTDTATRQAAHQHILGHIQEERSLDASIAGSKFTVQGFGLHHRAGEAIEQHAVCRVGMLQAIQDHLDDKVVRHQRATIHVGAGGPAQCRPVSSVLTEQVTRRHMRNSKKAPHILGLGALTSTRGTNQQRHRVSARSHATVHLSHGPIGLGGSSRSGHRSACRERPMPRNLVGLRVVIGTPRGGPTVPPHEYSAVSPSITTRTEEAMHGPCQWPSLAHTEFLPASSYTIRQVM